MYIEKLREAATAANNIVCMGIDPVIERIPFERSSVGHRIVRYFSEILDAVFSEDAVPSAVKPNYAFFAQYGFDGLKALKELIEKYSEAKIPVIFDGKRGDIGKSSTAYAKEVFEFWKADAVTVSPFLGSDSVKPFIEYCNEAGKGVYILNRTSNPGAKDLQDEQLSSGPVYMHISEKIAEWAKNSRGNVGAVVGATSIPELMEICKFYSTRTKLPMPLLIPGVGAQGGSAEKVVKTLNDHNFDLKIQRINSSSGITYAYERMDTDDFAGAAVKAIKKLNKEITQNISLGD